MPGAAVVSRRRIYFTRGGVPCEPYELADEPPADARLQINSDTHYDGARATDGTDISTRRRHREYMHRNGVTLADDFKGEWAKKAEQRERFYAGDFDKKSRTEAVERAMHALESGRRRKG